MKIPPLTKRILLGLIPLALVCAAASGGTPARTVSSEEGSRSASALVTPDPARLGESAEMTVTVTLPPGCETLPPEFGETYGDLTVEKVKADPPALAGNEHQTVFHVTLIPKKSGTLFLPPIPVAGRGADGERFRLLIPAGRLEVISRFDPAEASLSELSPPQPPVKRFPWILAAALLAGAVTAALCARGLFRSGIRFAAPKELTPRQRALRRLAVLKNSGLAESDLREYYIHLTGIVRVYIEETTGIRAPEQTTEEFLRHIETEPSRTFSNEARARLARFLEDADLVKFAKFRPAAEETAAGQRHAEEFVSTFEPAAQNGPDSKGGAR